MTNKKITYILGAGASAGTMPLVRGFSEKLQEVLDVARGKINPKEISENYCGLNLIKDLEDFLAQSSLDSSPDTYAKKCFIQSKLDSQSSEKQYIKLKYLLSCAFILIQAYNYPKIDKRYVAFLASILDSNGKLPEHVRIVSWNYDHEFELAYANFLGQMGQLHYDFSGLGWSDTETAVRVNTWGKRGFKYMKLNGTAGLYKVKNNVNIGCNELIDDYTTGITSELLDKLASCYDGLGKRELYNQLRFAWEEEGSSSPSQSEQFIDKVSDEIKDTSCLVVIGYSFPYYNKLIDTKLLQNMDPDRVYIQSKQTAEIRKRFLNIKRLRQDGMLQTVSDTDYFHIPNEF